MCAVCRSVAVPAVRHILRLTQHLAVAGVCVPRGAGSQDAKFTGRAAEEAHRRGIIQRELHCRRERSTYDEHQQQRAREGRAEFEGELLHAGHVPRGPLGRMPAHGPPCLLSSARMPTLVVIFFDYLSRTTRQAASVLAEHIGDGGALLRGGQGGSNAKEAVLELRGARLSRCGRIDVCVGCVRVRSRSRSGAP